MARGRRGHQHVEEDMERDLGVNAEVNIGNIGNGEPDMLEVIRVLMAEQRKSDLDREDRKEEAKRVEDNRWKSLGWKERLRLGSR